MVWKRDGWIPTTVRGCLETVGEFQDEQALLNASYEKPLDQQPRAVGRKFLLQASFQYTLSMLARQQYGAESHNNGSKTKDVWHALC